MEEREDVELEVSIMGGEALAGSVTTPATGLDIPFLLGLLGAMIQKMKEKRQKTRSRKNMSEEKNIYQTEGRLHMIETY